jgi:hypothetical protein
VVLVAVLALGGLACATTRAISLPPLDLSSSPVLIGDAVLPSQRNGAARPDVGGLSGAYYDARTQRLYAVSDDHDRPRLVTFEVTLSPAVSMTPRSTITSRRKAMPPTLKSPRPASTSTRARGGSCDRCRCRRAFSPGCAETDRSKD